MDPKEDDEISIDLSKIKNFFKSEKKEEKPVTEAQPKETAKENKEEEISIDFSKVKNFFKSKETKESSEGEELPIDWGRISDFFRKYGIIFLILIPIILSIYVRMQAGYLTFADDWATSSVMNNLKSQIKSGIDQQYPNLPEANKNALVDTEMQKVISQNNNQIDAQVKATSDYIKSFFQDENGKNYMPDIDPYYWFRYVKNIIDHGYPGDILKDGRSFDTYQIAPVGRFVTADFFHIYFLAYFYKVLHFFVPDLTIMRSMFYYPVFVAALSVLLVSLIAKKIAGNAGSFFAGLIMAVNVAFLGRTLFGHADSDAWVVFFPLMITWLFVITEDIKNIWKLLAVTILAGFFTGLYTLSWSGWWYIFDFLLVTISVTFAYLMAVNFKEIRNPKFFVLNHNARNIIVIGIAYFISTAVFAGLFSGFLEFRNSFLGPFSFPSIKSPVTPYIWPNVLTTVAELGEGSINAIINSVGGPFLFFISLMGLVLAISRNNGFSKFDYVYFILSGFFYWAYFFVRKSGLQDAVFVLLVWIMLPVILRILIAIYKKDSSYDFRLSILLALWMVSTIYASIKGIRFTLLLAPAFSVAFGVALGRIYTILSRISTKELKIHKAVASSVIIILLLLVYVNPIRGAINSAGSDIPLINDAWYNTLSLINNNSTKDAIITSWWDFGHHFKALADRRVTFDGTTQTDAASHWVGRFFMTDNEAEAFGIIRMLDCDHNTATIKLSNITNDLVKSVKIIKEIIVLDKEDASKKLLGYGLSNEQASKILSSSHCNPPEAFIIASEDMIGKSGVWSHFGSWNFERADIWFNARKMPQDQATDYMMKKFNYSKEKAENIYFEMQAITSDSEANSWVAPWPGYGGTVNCRKNEEVYVCSNGLQINYSSYEVFGISQQGIVKPKAAAFTTENGMIRKDFSGETLDFGITIIPLNENEVEGVLSSKELTGSMFIRMFYMQGHGLKYFDLFNHQRGLTGTDIYTYKVDWTGKNVSMVQDYVDFFKKPQQEKLVTNLTSNS